MSPESFLGETVSGLQDRQNRLDPKRLKSITAIFGEANLGLGFALSGAAIAAQRMVEVCWPENTWANLGAWLLLAAAGVAAFYIPGYYRSRFGWVEKKPPPVSPARELALVILVGLLITSFMAAWMFQEVFKPPENFMVLWQSGVVLCVLLGVAFTARGRSRPVSLTICAALAVVQGLVAVLPRWVSMGPRQMFVWKLLNAGSLGIFVMVIGICNHITMVRLLPGPGLKDEHD